MLSGAGFTRGAHAGFDVERSHGGAKRHLAVRGSQAWVCCRDIRKVSISREARLELGF